ncbi:MAG: glycosyltransferase [Armatimonadetes bacterium]|nr:glycosyltransferase [Armatimonadota bacterium]
MAGYLVYTSPARGHLFPLVPTLRELENRGHEVRLRTLSPEVEPMRALGLTAESISAAVEQRELDDWKAANPVTALRRAGQTFVDRAAEEIVDLHQAIRRHRPDALFVDINSWGAMAAAEASGLPWAAFAPYFLPFQAAGIPPWGLGLAPRHDLVGRFRDAVLWWLVQRLFDGPLAQLNGLRRQLGLGSLSHALHWVSLPPRLLYYTAEPFEYPRSWPAHVRLVGPGIWEPPPEASDVPHDERPVVLVTCSTEFQNDGSIIQMALDGLSREPVRVVATTAAVDPRTFQAPANTTVERFLPHGPLLERAACVVCHGGMGITQKALSAGVPLCVVPFGRDQLEVARHVEMAGAGVRLSPRGMTPEKLREAVRGAMSKRAGAEAMAEAFRRVGGPGWAADLLEELLVKRKRLQTDERSRQLTAKS